MSRDVLPNSAGRQESKRPETFWGRQFGDSATRPQTVFDVCVGILLPVACLVFDPFVFRDGWGAGILDAPLLGPFRLFAYALVALEIAALAAWLALGRRAREWTGPLGGVLAAGAIFSLLVGILLLPFSVIGLLFVIGLLGFSPFVTALVYWRNGRRAWLAAAAFLTEGQRKWLRPAAGLLALALPAFAQLEVSRLVARSVPELASADPSRAASAERALRLIGRAADTDLDGLVWAYQREADAARRDRMARAYYELTGREIEDRLRVLMY